MRTIHYILINMQVAPEVPLLLYSVGPATYTYIVNPVGPVHVSGTIRYVFSFCYGCLQFHLLCCF